MLKKEQRISRTKDYNNIYKNGTRLYSRYFVVIYLPGQGENNRYGIVASKKVGNAVVRNSAKRRIRALVACYNSVLRKRFDFAIIARPAVKTATYELLEKDFLIVMRKFISAKKYINQSNQTLPEN